MDSSSKDKKELGWKEWLKGWYRLILETFFEKYWSRHLPNPFPLPPLNGITAIVTGSTSGIGLETARQLAESGAHVVMAVRNTDLAHKLIQQWNANSNSNSKVLDIEVMELNLSSLESVAQFAKEWNSKHKPLNLLINNAGVFSMAKSKMYSTNGYESHMQVNFLAPSLLSLLLLPSLKSGAPSRIVNVNSLMHGIGYVDLHDLNFDKGVTKFSSLKAYSRSKLAQIMFNNILHGKIPKSAGINIVCVDPGSVRTNVARDLPKIIQKMFRVLPTCLFSAEEGSRSVLYAGVYDEIWEYCEKLREEEWPVCAYVACDCKVMIPSKEARNMEISRELWKMAIDMIGVANDVVDRVFDDEEIHCRYLKGDMCSNPRCCQWKT